LSTPKSVLAVVPARGGSKGLPRKNIRELAGLPLIGYSIRAGLDCPLVDRTVVTTEDEEIKASALRLGAEVIDRPHQYATDSSQTHDVVVHLVHELGKSNQVPDIIALLQPTSPLRTSKHLTESLELFLASNASSLVSVCECEHHPFKSLKREEGYLRPLFGYKALEQRRQDLPQAFRPNGAIFLISIDKFMQERMFFVDPILSYVMDTAYSIDIDTEMDLQLASVIMEKYKLYA
jgi:CMP-N,N'-diacetyllegionaminic acid synthase